MYSPKIAKELIPILYQVAKARRIPMTKLVEQLLRKALEHRPHEAKGFNEQITVPEAKATI